MNEKLRKYLTLFLATFQLSACTFGGGFVIVPLMRRKFVEGLGWIEELEMLDLTAIAQSCPGAIAVNAAILVGYRCAGIAGALVTVFGTVLPPLIIISVISFFYAAFRDNRIVSLFMQGMLAGVAAVICDVVVTMCAGLLKERSVLHIAVLLAAFAAVRFLDINIIFVILGCALLGLGEGMLRARLERRRA